MNKIVICKCDCPPDSLRRVVRHIVNTVSNSLSMGYWMKKHVFFLKKKSGRFFFLKFIYYLWVCWVFVSVQGPSLVAASGGHSSSRCAGLSSSRPLSLRSTGSRRAGSVIVAHGPSCSAAYGILPDRGSNPCPLHWQADPQPLRHQGSPKTRIFYQTAPDDSVEFTCLQKHWSRFP